MKLSLASFLQPLLLLTHLFSSVHSRSEDWSAKDGALFFRQTIPFKVKAASWFGMETCDFVQHGLWQHPMTWYLDYLQENQFNMLRVPVSEEWVKNGFETHHPNPQQLSADPTLQHNSTLQILDALFDECERRSIYILLDMHRLHCDAQSHEVWYTDDGQFSTQDFFNSWQKLINRYASHPAFHAIDLLNEPRGRANMGSDPHTSWKLFVEQAFQELHYDGVIHIQGINWGHDLSGLRDNPLNVDPYRVVYSPHMYGPSVVGAMDLNPNSLRNHWDNMFGFLVKERKTVIIGEWGGTYVGDDKQWQDTFADYLIDLKIGTGYYWCVNPDSSDSHGILQDDWTSSNYEKLVLLKRIQPYPTLFAPRDPVNHHQGKYLRHN